MLFEPQKGKAFDKLPIKDANEFDNKIWITSTKFDGNQIFIVKKNNIIRWFTSDWKEFKIPELEYELLKNHDDFVIAAEFMYNSVGKLGDRRKSAILTTLRTCFNKGISNPYTFKSSLCNIKVFDIILYEKLDSVQGLQTEYKYKSRLEVASLVYLPNEITKISTSLISGYDAKIRAKRLVQEGWEGCMCVDPDSTYKIGKRVNYSVKLKYRKTADLLCIDVTKGEGKYAEMIGALVLQDSKGRIVSVGSGLEDKDRQPELCDYYKGKIIEIEYEQLMDTYIQPTFVCIRMDKTKPE